MKKGDYSREVNIMNNEEKRCSGCGVLLQDQNLLQEGYTTSLDNDICQRCFRMKNYGEYQVVTKSNDDYLKILKSVGETKDLVLYITDLLNLEKNIEQIRTIIPNKMIVFHNTTSLILSLISIVALLFHKQRLSHLRRAYGYVRTKVHSGESLCILMNQL